MTLLQTSNISSEELNNIFSDIEENLSNNLPNEIDYDPAVTHRNIFRGKNLGTSFTAEQKTNIQNGTFDDLYVGDYWKINNITWRIADIDYYFNTGSTPLTQHHLVIVPDECLYTATMNSTADTSTGYYNSEMKKSNLSGAINSFKEAFGENNILYHTETVSSAASNGIVSSLTEKSTQVDIMNERMVYGTNIYEKSNSPSIDAVNNKTESKTQLTLFRLAPQFIVSTYNGSRQYWWLRDIMNASYFANVFDDGRAAYSSTINAFGVRPAALIG